MIHGAGLAEVARGYTTSNPETGNYTAAAGRYYLFVDGYQGATANYTLTVTGGLAKAGGEAVAGAPAVFALHPNAPNPVLQLHPSTQLQTDPEDGDAEVGARRGGRTAVTRPPRSSPPRGLRIHKPPDTRAGTADMAVEQGSKTA